MAFCTNACMSAGVNAAGLKAAWDAAGTAGSSGTWGGVAATLTGCEMNTGWFVSALVARVCMMGLMDSTLGATMGEASGGKKGVLGVFRVEVDDAWW